MLREDSHDPRSKSRGIKPFVNDADGEGINHFYLLHRFIVRESRGEVLGIHDRFIGELDIMGVKGMAVMKFNIGPQLKNDNGIIFCGRQNFIGRLHPLAWFNLRSNPYVSLPIEGSEIILAEDLTKT